MPKGSYDGSVFKRVEEVAGRNGKVKLVERWYARVRYTDPHGRTRELKRRAPSYATACEVRRTLVRLAEQKSAQPLDSDRLTFADLVAYYSRHYAVPAQYVHERKVAGLRSLPTVERQLRVLAEHFSKKLLRRLTHGDLRSFRALRLRTPTLRRGGQRSIASVNRELALLRRMLNVAVQEGWLQRNPFSAGDSLISPADERRRERILSFDEEERLLASCHGRRTHLRAIIIAALDTGMRKGELLKLRWSDVDFGETAITVRAFNTKTMCERRIVMTIRLAEALRALMEHRPPMEDALVFGFDDVKRSFAGACRDAGIVGLRFHDLRHTAASRLISAHIPLEEVGKQLGHTQQQTTWRYVNVNMETARRAAAALDGLRAEREAGLEPEEESDRVN
jgi:integrase